MKLRRILVMLGISIALLLVATGLIFSGAWIPNQPSRAEYPVRGIDISHHQGNIRWNAVAGSGIGFAYIKATEGADYDDPDFKQNWDAAAAAHMARGAYHFFIVDSPGKLQAEHFISRVPVDTSALPPAIDIELPGGNRAIVSTPALQRELSEFINIVATHYGKPLVVYSSRDFRNRYLQGMPVDSWWISDIILIPAQNPDAHWKFWQFTWRGRISGIDGFVDLDVFSGSQSEFEALIGNAPKN